MGLLTPRRTTVTKKDVDKYVNCYSRFVKSRIDKLGRGYKGPLNDDQVRMIFNDAVGHCRSNTPLENLVFRS